VQSHRSRAGCFEHEPEELDKGQLETALKYNQNGDTVFVVKTAKRPRRKSEGELLDNATNSLLKALKRDMLAKEGRVDSEKLKKEGYSERLITRLEKS
jgi:hypothetical protein